MPKKYHIDTAPAPPRIPPVGKHCIIDLYEECARGCKNCVKHKCVYGLYDKEVQLIKDIDEESRLMNECMNCLMCVQNCTRGALTRVENPEYKWLGDEYWTPDQIYSIWKQATTGAIPVSGAGYRGKFTGSGFDALWTDMSEIVRPTRDGIHGREYISSSVDIGAKPAMLSFTPDGDLATDPLPVIDLPVPFMLVKPPFGDFSENTHEAMAMAAQEMDTFFIIDAEEITGRLVEYAKSLAPRMKASDVDKYASLIKDSRIVSLGDCPDVMDGVAKVKEIDASIIVMISVELADGIESRVSELARQGAEALTLHADFHGNVGGGDSPEFIKDAFERIHNQLLDDGTRDQITLIADGGISTAEHVPKIIICGADCVLLGLPFQIAMECRACRNCERGLDCPVDMAGISPEYGKTRILNLAASWRNQLLEVLGAMGIREVRRLRGEFGRAMFYKDLERDIFKKLFSKKES